MESTSKTPLKILVIDDSLDDLDLLLLKLRKGGFVPTFKRVDDETSLIEALRESWQVIVCDFNMPKLSAKRALEIARPTTIPFFVVSGNIDENEAVDLMKSGAQDYVMKDNLTRLIPAIYRELDEVARREALNQNIQKKEDQLQQAQKMEAIGRLAGGIAHDFNNFLGGIMVMNELVISKTDKEHPAYNDLKQIQNSIVRAAELPRQLLTFSRHQNVELSVVDLNETIKHIQKMLERILGKDIDLTIKLAERLDCIYLDRSQLEQTIMNLVVNARDAMEKGGRLAIETAKIEIEYGLNSVYGDIEPGKYVMLKVEDTGCGMDKKTMDQIFEPFFTTKGAEGTGLGLSSVFGIVQKGNGHIRVESTLGAGTQFKIYFPAWDLKGTVSKIEESKTSVRPKGSGTILIVDDQDELRIAVSGALENSGYDVISTSSPLEALAIFEKNPTSAQLLVTDIMMPEMNGIELIEKLKLKIPALKIIVMTGFLDSELLRNVELPEGTQVLQKPFSTKVLLDTVSVAFDT